MIKFSYMLFPLLIHTIAGIIGFWLAGQLIPEVIIGSPAALFLAGWLMGFLNTVLKPIRLIFMGLANFAITLTAVFIIDILLSPNTFGPNLVIPHVVPLIWTALVVAIVDGIACLIFRI